MPSRLVLALVALSAVLLVACGVRAESEPPRAHARPEPQAPAAAEEVEARAGADGGAEPAEEAGGSAEELPQAAGEGGEPPWEGPGTRTGLSKLGTYFVAWRPDGGEVPENEHFELELWLYRADEEGRPAEPVEDARIGVSGWMPDHGHGMIRQPRASHLGEGHYRIAGMLFHMDGFWQLFFDVIEDGIAERAEFELEL